MILEKRLLGKYQAKVANDSEKGQVGVSPGYDETGAMILEKGSCTGYD